MSFIYEIQNGNIKEGVLYQVVSGTLIYNYNIYNQGDYFVGVADEQGWGYAAHIMTSNTLPSGVCSASSIYSTTYDAWKAFNRTSVYGTTDRWVSGATQTMPQWIQYQLDSSILVNQLQIVNINYDHLSALNNAPKDFIVQGSNDGTVWTDLLTVVGETWTTYNEVKLYSFANTVSYTRYRLYITAIQDNSLTPYVQLSQVNFLYQDPNLILTEASVYAAQSFGIENDFYLGLFTDPSIYYGIAVGVAPYTPPTDGSSEVDTIGEFITFSVGNDKSAFIKRSVKKVVLDTATDTVSLIFYDNDIKQYMPNNVVDPSTGEKFIDGEALRYYIVNNI